MEQEQEEEISLKRFLKWATELGITDSGTTNPSPVEPISCLGHSLFVSHFPDAGGRGLGAARDLIKGELILRVPRSALMTSESLLRHDHSLSLALTNHPSLSSTQILGVCLLAEVGKGKNSWWYPYLMQLPRSYDTLAAFGSFERQALQVDYAIWAAEKATCKAECEWKEAAPLMKELNLKPHLLSFKAWLWVSSTISSRTMHVPWDEAGCLCPVGDFFNYAAPGEDIYQYGAPCSQRHASSSPEECSLWDGDATGKLEEDDAHMQRLTDGCYDEALGSYCFYARRNYKKGEQVIDFLDIIYGSISLSVF
ncbi:SET domain [Dillenia turbinata]|uniref:SET domain n=1 Tax=Dillenia turbinata TaxID=194707 RepID=A0AAN8UBB5_9MAGN